MTKSDDSNLFMENETISDESVILGADEIEESDDETLKSIDDVIFESFEKKFYEEENEVNVKKEHPEVEIALEQAVQDFKNGEATAFDFIYGQYKPKLERLAWRKNDEDLVQELSIILLKAVETFNINGGAKFNTYFWKCAQNHMGTLNIRKNAKKRTAEFGVVSMQQSFSTKDSEVELGAFVEDTTAETDFEQNMFKMILEKNVYPYLKPNEITAIKMLLHGYTLEEIGKELGGITAPAVHVKFRRLAEKKNVGKQLKLLHEMFY